MIHVLSCGRNVERWAADTIASVPPGFRGAALHVVVDQSEDRSVHVVTEAMAARGMGQDTLTVNDERHYATPNQRTALANADPAPDDIIVWLDLDGDRLLPGALARIEQSYDDGALLTFGSHICVPPAPGNRPAVPYPPEVIAANSYRSNIMANGAGFNHPRTMAGAVYRAIPDDHFYFHKGPRKGEPYDYGADYVFMVPGLELAGPRHEYIRDPLLAYNHANPEADYLVSGPDTGAVLKDLLARDPLGPLEARRQDGSKLCLPDDDRRKIIRGYADKHGLTHLVETGTYKGDTAEAMAAHMARVDTIELDPRLHRRANERLRRLRHVTCHQGNSQKVLPGILRTVTEPVLFWLDGHTSGPDTATSPCPLRAEIMLALAHAYEHNLGHVILVDDARCLYGQPSHREWQHYSDYPSLEWIAAQAEASDYSCELADDVVRLEKR